MPDFCFELKKCCAVATGNLASVPSFFAPMNQLSTRSCDLVELLKSPGTWRVSLVGDVSKTPWQKFGSAVHPEVLQRFHHSPWLSENREHPPPRQFLSGKKAKNGRKEPQATRVLHSSLYRYILQAHCGGPRISILSERWHTGAISPIGVRKHN